MINKKKNIVFICELLPIDTGASSVLFYRHLKHFEAEGHKISIITTDQSSKNIVLIPENWKVHILPSRKWYYPPYRVNYILKNFRYILLFFNAYKFLKSNNPDVIIGCIYGIYLSGWCSFLSKLMNKPLFMFYHDRAELLNYSNNPSMQKITMNHNINIVRQATKIWTVSEQLIYANWSQKFELVYPIPEKINLDVVKWKQQFAITPIIGYAGSLYNEAVDTMLKLAEVLNTLNGHLIILTHQTENAEKIKSKFPSTLIKSSVSTFEACKFIQQKCSAFIITYPEDINEMPWIDSCFPSKFTQFIHTGLPILVLAPQEAAISIWCLKNKWEGYTNQYEMKDILSFISLIQKEESWKRLSKQSIVLSTLEFDPDKIHLQLLI